MGSPESKPLLAGLLKDFYDTAVKPDDILIVNPYSIKQFIDEGRESLDSEGKLRTGSQFLETKRDITCTIVNTADFTVEMQVARDSRYLKRILYYWADLYMNNYGKKNDESKYESLKPVWSLNILDFELFADDDCYHIFDIRNRREPHNSLPMPLKDIMLLGFFELNKDASVIPAWQAWKEFLKTGQVPDCAPAYL